jgi:hypothetical protein
MKESMQGFSFLTLPFETIQESMYLCLMQKNLLLMLPDPTFSVQNSLSLQVVQFENIVSSS